MQRFFPFIFAIAATLLAVAVTFVLARAQVISVGRAIDKAAVLVTEEATE